MTRAIEANITYHYLDKLTYRGPTRRMGADVTLCGIQGDAYYRAQKLSTLDNTCETCMLLKMQLLAADRTHQIMLCYVYDEIRGCK